MAEINITAEQRAEVARCGGILFEPKDTYCEIHLKEAKEGAEARPAIYGVLEMKEAYRVVRQDHPEVEIVLVGGPQLVFPAVTGALDAVIDKYSQEARKPLEVAVRPNPTRS